MGVVTKLKGEVMLQAIKLLGIKVSKSAIEELKTLKKTLWILIVGIFTISLLSLFNFNVITIPTIILIGVIIGIRIIKDIKSFVGVALLGEFLELIHAIPAEKGPKNIIITAHANIIAQLYVGYWVIAFLLIKLPLGNQWWLALAWPTMLILLIFLAVGLGQKRGWTIYSSAFLLLMSLILSLLMATFPQIRAQLGIDKLGYLITPTGVSEMVNAGKNNLKKLRVNELKADAEVVRQATATTPYRELLPEHREFLDAGGRKTLREIVEELNSPQTAKNGKFLPPAEWQELITPGPDANGFYQVATPSTSIGKTSVVFKKEVIAEKANGNEKIFAKPKKVLGFSNGIRAGGLPDIKFRSPLSPGEKILVKFQ